jgi:hypothetical protein
MEFKFSYKEFYYPFSLKKPIVYIFLFISICIYFVIFYMFREKEYFGVINPSKGFTIAILSLFTFFSFHLFRGNDLLKKINSMFFRSLILIGYISINIICMIPAWTFYKYDSEKIEKYRHILPFKNTLILNKKTLVFSDIKSLEYVSGVDLPGDLRFNLNNGNQYYITISNHSRRSISILLYSIYKKYDRLKYDIEHYYGSIEKLENSLNDESVNFNIIDFIINTFCIWIFIVLNICLIFYIFKLK